MRLKGNEGGEHAGLGLGFLVVWWSGGLMVMSQEYWELVVLWTEEWRIIIAHLEYGNATGNAIGKAE